MSMLSRQQIQVLHVDDEPKLAELTATFLQREDDRFTVETATSANEGLQLLEESEIDCIVSDYQMPGMNGIEFLESVVEKHPNLPFILYTGKGSEEVASEAIGAGVTDYLQKESGTDDYTLLANRILNAVDSQRRERRIQFFETLESELTELSIDFLRGEGSDIDILIDRTLEKIGTLVDADRTYVFDIDHDAETVTNTHEWCSGGVEPQIDMLQDIPQDTLPWWTQKLKNFENIIIPNVSELPPEAEAEQEILQEQNIESLIVTPMISNGELVGFIGFDWLEEQDAWSDEFINILRLVSELITTARERRERKQELRKLTNRLNFAVEGANLGVWDWNIQTDSVTFNQQWAEMLGLSLDEIEPTLDTWEQRVHPEDIDAVNAALDAHINGKTDYYDTVHRMQTATGEWKWVRDTGRVAERNEDGEPIRAVGIHRDITEQKEQQQELEEFETIIEALTDAVYVLDEEGRFTYVNDEFVELVDYNKERIIGSKPSLIKGEEAAEQAERQLGRLLSSDGPETVVFEVTVHPRDGDPILCEDHIGVLPYEGDQFNGSVGALRDVTDRKKREQELQDLKSQYETLAENFPDGAVFLIDTELEYVRAGGEELSNVGLSPDDIEGANPHALFPEEIAEELGHYYEEALDGNANTFEQEYGGERYRSQTVPVWTDDERIEHVMAVSQNITERAEDKQNLEHQNERLEEFASVVSHDLRNPLNVAQSQAELLEDDCPNEHVGPIVESLDRMEAIISDTLTLARQGQTISDTESVALVNLIAECWRNVRTDEATIEIEDDVTIRGDRSRLQHVFENLFRNALEHGGADVTVRIGRIDDRGMYVEDTGPGIPEDARESVFEPGYTSGSSGTGFGLTIVKRIAEAHDWQVEIGSGTDGGTRVEFTGVNLD